MADSNSFMAGKLRIPDKPQDLEKDKELKFVPQIKSKKVIPEPEKPWIGQASIRELERKNTARLNLQQVKPTVPEVPKVDNVPTVPNAVEQSPIAPIRDFHRVSNSINREALEGGMFTRPSCKQVYDALYLLTRGAIQPSRKIQIGRKQLLKKAGIGSDKTLDAAVNSLQMVGLLKVHVSLGNQKGNFYEVILPEEIQTYSTDGTLGTVGTSSTTSTLSYKIPNVPSVEPTYSTDGQISEKPNSYSTANTSSNTSTKNDDDTRAAFGEMFEKLNAAVKKLTGKEASKREAEKWGTLADLLILELEVAASRTGNISSVPSFLTEVLRRQFFSSRQKETLTKPSKTKKDTVGKSESENFEIKPLDEKGRESALEQLQEFAGDEFLEDFRKWYTPEDWDWLVKELASK